MKKAEQSQKDMRKKSSWIMTTKPSSAKNYVLSGASDDSSAIAFEVDTSTPQWQADFYKKLHGFSWN